MPIPLLHKILEFGEECHYYPLLSHVHPGAGRVRTGRDREGYSNVSAQPPVTRSRSPLNAATARPASANSTTVEGSGDGDVVALKSSKNALPKGPPWLSNSTLLKEVNDGAVATMVPSN